MVLLELAHQGPAGAWTTIRARGGVHCCPMEDILTVPHDDGAMGDLHVLLE